MHTARWPGAEISRLHSKRWVVGSWTRFNGECYWLVPVASTAGREVERAFDSTRDDKAFGCGQHRTGLADRRVGVSVLQITSLFPAPYPHSG